MAQWTYNYYDQEAYPREPSIRVYSYQPRPSTERRLDDLQRYPGVYKLFNNNRSSHGEPSPAHHGPPVHSQASHGSTDPAHHGSPVHSQASHGSTDPAPSQRHVGDQRDAAHSHRQKVKFAERKEETAKGGSVDDAADGFITWKRKNLQMCKTFGE